jgi:membrane-associated phospholipid phosphatase
VGFSRMYLFQHFITDVVWGALIGLLWAVLVDWGYRQKTTKNLIKI